MAPWAAWNARTVGRPGRWWEQRLPGEVPGDRRQDGVDRGRIGRGADRVGVEDLGGRGTSVEM